MPRGEDSTKRESRSSLGNSFRSAAAGWMQALRSERNLRIHLVACGIVCVLCLWFRLSRLDLCLIVAAVTVVWLTELLNSALERIVDLASPEYSELARDAKDMSAAAVLTAAAGAVLIGVLVFGPHAVNVVIAALGRL